MRSIAIGMVALLLGSCGSGRQPAPAQASGEAPAGSRAVAAAASARSTVLPIPADKAQLERLETMGYKLHADHLDPPGAASCPKMSENPIQ